jgi:serine/threonine protein kinase
MTQDQWRQIEELYQAVLECEPNQRASLLEGSDSEVRARVERMLRIESGSHILEHSADRLLATSHQDALHSGEHLGPYRIEVEVGAGGMGTVYRAFDTRLGRTVAIKIAAERYGERFEREARAISTLNHPHICTLYDVGPNYLVMEFLEGSTLAATIKQQPFPPELVARYGAQIADALAEAHSVRIVHRDLKPSNIMLTRHGVKVLDFGLAKIVPGNRTALDARITETGSIMGTPAYMAPEQVEGHEPSHASDLFSLGLVIYEMLTGRLPFPGASLGQLLSSGTQVPLPEVPRGRSGILADLHRLIGKLLQRDPAARPQSAAEVAQELLGLAGRHAHQQSRSHALSGRAYLLLAIAFVIMIGAAGLRFYQRGGMREGSPPVPNVSAPYTQLTSFTDSAEGPTLSPDGRMLAFYRSDHAFLTTDEIWIKLLPNGDPIQVTHDPRLKYNIAFSQDGSRIAYTVFGNDLFQTYTVSSMGGDSHLLLPNAAGLGWLNDGYLLFSQIKGSGVHMGIVTAKPDRSDLREIYFPVLDRQMAHYSYLSPDGKWVLLAEMDPRWHPCRVVPFAGGSEGTEVGPAGAPCDSAAWSPDGNWIYVSARVEGRQHLWRQRFPNGQPEQITFGAAEEKGIALAPDGHSLITSIVTMQRSVWIHDAQGEEAVSTDGYAENSPPTFSRDGKRIYYLLRHDSPESAAELWRADVASRKAEAILPGFSLAAYDISDDEKEVVFSTHPAGAPSQLWIADLDHRTSPRRIAATGEDIPHFGPQGEIVFRQTDGKSYYLASMARDGSGVKRIVPYRVLSVDQMSPDRRFVKVGAALSNTRDSNEPSDLMIPIERGPSQKICDGQCWVAWSPDGKYFSVQLRPPSRELPAGKTVVLRVPSGAALPSAPVGELIRPETWAKVPGAETVGRANITPGMNPSIYAYVKSSVHANLFRIPLH